MQRWLRPAEYSDTGFGELDDPAGEARRGERTEDRQDVIPHAAPVVADAVHARLAVVEPALCVVRGGLPFLPCQRSCVPSAYSFRRWSRCEDGAFFGSLTWGWSSAASTFAMACATASGLCSANELERSAARPAGKQAARSRARHEPGVAVCGRRRFRHGGGMRLVVVIARLRHAAGLRERRRPVRGARSGDVRHGGPAQHLQLQPGMQPGRLHLLRRVRRRGRRVAPSSPGLARLANNQRRHSACVGRLQDRARPVQRGCPLRPQPRAGRVADSVACADPSPKR